MDTVMQFLQTEEGKNKCTGCAACQNICPKSAIDMRVEVIEGYYPIIDVDKCILCSKCVLACPELRETICNDYQKAGYAVVASRDLLMKSSSGGVFSVVADSILDSVGTVYGVAWNDSLEAEHIRVTDKNEISRLRYSKYVQSNTSKIFREVAKDLDDNKKVLFTGCPCQIAGLKSFVKELKADDSKLFCIDLVCGGAPSPRIWEMYLDEKYNNQRPADYRFRDKTHGWGVFSTNKIDQVDYTDVVNDYYAKAFYQSISLSNSCINCRYKTDKCGDLTIGDFWNVKKQFPSLNTTNGVSVVIVNTKKGEKLFREVRSQFEVVKKADLEVINLNGGFRKIVNDGSSSFKRAIKEGKTLKEACGYGVEKKYDVGLVGEWCNHNYGSHLTYYALKRAIEELGYSVLLIGPPVNWWKYSKNIFGDDRFRTIPSIDSDVAYLSTDEYDYEYLNERCNVFCVGSDTTFNDFQFFDKKEYAGLAWTDDCKGRLVYGGSFGGYDFNESEQKISRLKYCFSRFDKVSFREESAVELAKDIFGVDSCYVLDPVFLVADVEWRKLACKPKQSIEDTFGIVFFYEDNGYREETDGFINELEEKLKCKFYYVTRSESERKNALPKVTMNELIWLIDNAKFILTNSFHVTSMSIILNKQFYSVNRTKQLPARINNILDTFNLSDRKISDYRYDEVNVENIKRIDYSNIENVMSGRIESSRKWLKDALAQAMSRNDCGWNEVDYLRRRVDDLSSMVLALTNQVNQLCKETGLREIKRLSDGWTVPAREEVIKEFASVDLGEIEAYLKKNNYCKLAVYGIGIVGKVVVDRLESLKKIKIKYLIDKKIQHYKNYSLYSEPQNIEVDVIVVTVLGQNKEMNRILNSFYRSIDVLFIDEWIDEMKQH